MMVEFCRNDFSNHKQPFATSNFGHNATSVGSLYLKSKTVAIHKLNCTIGSFSATFPNCNKRYSRATLTIYPLMNQMMWLTEWVRQCRRLARSFHSVVIIQIQTNWPTFWRWAMIYWRTVQLSMDCQYHRFQISILGCAVLSVERLCWNWFTDKKYFPVECFLSLAFQH